jgi:hypothetical protein
MSTQVTAAFVEQYGSNVEHLVQQGDSRFEGKVRMESQKGKTKFWEQLGATAAVKRTNRHSDTPRVDSEHRRRQATLQDYEWSDLIDDLDEVKMLANFRSPYAQSAAMAMRRAKDQEIIDASVGTAYADDDGDAAVTAVTLPASQKVAVDFGGATIGQTLAKLVEAKSILGKNEVPRGTKLYMVQSQQQLDDMLVNVDQVRNADYAAVKALVQGEVDYFMGFEFIRTELLALSAGDIRTCFAYAYPGLMCVVGQDYRARITERDDKSYSTQVYFSMSVGATRMQEKMVVEVLADESP